MGILAQHAEEGAMEIMNMPENNISVPVKKRYEWIDNSRVIASILIMYVHLPLALPETNVINNAVVNNLTSYCVYAGRVSVFLMLSGYLFGRNASWFKTLDRFLWLLIPYVLWNLIIWGSYLAFGSHTEVSIFQVMGIGAVFDSSIVISPAGPVKPCLDAPAWYMRDMLPLTLLTPFFVKYKRYIPYAILFIVLCFHGDWRMKSEVMMAPSTVCFYMFGVYLTNFKIEQAYGIFTDKFTPVVVFGFLIACATSLAYTVFHLGICMPVKTPLGLLFGSMMIAHCGVLIERKLPKLSKKLVPLGPASFLIFMIHWPIFHLVAHIWPGLTHSLWVLLLPWPVYCLIAGTFLAMKKYTPWLMPYLGHMKIKKAVGVQKS